MPNTASAKKRIRQGESRALRNKARRTRMRTLMRQVREAVEAGDKATAQALLPQAYQAIDKAAQRHIIHENNAAHKKAKLAKSVGKLG